MTARWGIAALLALVTPDPAPSLAAWHGTWTGEGTAFGKAAAATLVIGPVPDSSTTVLAYKLAPPGTPPIAYAAEAIYRVDAKERVRGSWTDSSGRTRPIGGRIAGSEWHNHWGSADVEIGRSTYALEALDRLIVTDSVLKDDGSWRAFATLRFQRKP